MIFFYLAGSSSLMTLMLLPMHSLRVVLVLMFSIADVAD
jgi:hypothetical protein